VASTETNTSLTDTSTFPGYDNNASSNDDSYRGSLFPDWSDGRNNYDVPEDRNDSNANIDNAVNRSENRSSDSDRYSRPNYLDYGYDSGSDYYLPGSAVGSEFRMDSPLPGYSSRYPNINEVTSTQTPSATSTPVTPITPTAATTTNVSATIMETEPTVPQTRRPLSVQEKLELRLATPFSLSLSDSQDASSDQYIPPDFLPSHENGIVKLVDSSAEPAITISPVTFGSQNTSDASPETEEVGEIIP
jgi:hypothetical protein